METPPFDLAGKVVLVTGAARRIGRSIALRLAREGARVAIHYNNSESDARRTADECGGAELFQANLEKVPDIKRMFSQVRQRLGRLDGLVNNAARFTRFDPLKITEADWDFIHSVNLKAVFFCCQQAAPLMRESGGGRIVNISSLGGIRPWAEHAHYCASKAGVIMLTRALAKAFAPDIAVNSVAPGVIQTPMLGEIKPEVMAEYERQIPLGRVGRPEDVANAVLFFASEESEYITAQTLPITGGWF